VIVPCDGTDQAHAARRPGTIKRAAVDTCIGAVEVRGRPDDHLADMRKKLGEGEAKWRGTGPSRCGHDASFRPGMLSEATKR
jgi:hypothetical protein